MGRGAESDGKRAAARAPDEADAMRRGLARGTVELAILALLAEGQRYGYELLTSVDEATGGAVELKEGTLYPILHRLEDAGVVETSWEAQGRSAPRKYYRITRAGRGRFAALLGEWDRLSAGMERLLRERRRP